MGGGRRGDMDNFSVIGQEYDRKNKQRNVLNLQHIKQYKKEVLRENTKDDFQIMLANISSKPLFECRYNPKESIPIQEHTIIQEQLGKYFQKQKDLFDDDVASTDSVETETASHPRTLTPKKFSILPSLPDERSIPVYRPSHSALKEQQQSSQSSLESSEAQRKKQFLQSPLNKFSSFYGRRESVDQKSIPTPSKQENSQNPKDRTQSQQLDDKEKNQNNHNNTISGVASTAAAAPSYPSSGSRYKKTKCLTEQSSPSIEKSEKKFFNKIIPMNAALKITPSAQAGLCEGIVREAIKQLSYKRAKKNKVRQNPYSPKNKRQQEELTNAPSRRKQNNETLIQMEPTRGSSPTELFLESIYEKSQKAKQYINKMKIIDAGGTCQNSDEDDDDDSSSDGDSSEADSLKSYMPKSPAQINIFPPVMQQKQELSYGYPLERTKSLLETPKKQNDVSSLRMRANSKRESPEKKKTQISTTEKKVVEFLEDEEIKRRNGRFLSMNYNSRTQHRTMTDYSGTASVQNRGEQFSGIVSRFDQIQSLRDIVENKDIKSASQKRQSVFIGTRNSIAPSMLISNSALEASSPVYVNHNQNSNSQSRTPLQTTAGGFSGGFRTINSSTGSSEQYYGRNPKERIRESAALERANAYIKSKRRMFPDLDWNKHQVESLCFSKIEALSNKSTQLSYQFTKISKQLKKELNTQERLHSKRKTVEEMIFPTTVDESAAGKMQISENLDQLKLLNDKFYIALEDNASYEKFKLEEETRIENLHAYHQPYRFPKIGSSSSSELISTKGQFSSPQQK